VGQVRRDLGTLRQELLTRKIELEEEMTRLQQEQFSDGQVQDPGDQALSATMEALKGSFHDAKQDEYTRITQALQMIEDGTYGICSDCQLPISEKRLRLYPNATRCLACQEAFEESGE
jgi:DnaK suppressor protein